MTISPLKSLLCSTTLLLPLACAALDAPRLLAPGTKQAPGPALDDSVVAFRWTDVAGATGYQLLIRQEDAGESENYTFPIGASFAEVELIAGRPYQWQIAALVGDHPGAVSATNYFSIAVKQIYPAIGSVVPNPVPAVDGVQVLIVNGREFRRGCRLVLRDQTTGERFENLKIAQLRYNHFVVTPNFTKAEDHWSAEVINPGGFSSGQFAFDVVSRAHIARWLWWRSGWPWFWACLAVAVLSGAGLWRQHRRVLAAIPAARDEARRMEHTRMSRDLHDSVNSLNQVNLLAGKLPVMLQTGEPAERIRNTARAVSSAAVEAGNLLEDLIWVSRPESENLENLVARLRQKIGRFREFNPDVNCAVDFPLEVPARTIAAAASTNLLRTTSELLRNVVKHAGCSQLNCRLAVQDSRLCLTIADNGIGFQPDGHRAAGHGLPNLRRRAEESGGAFTLETAPGKGTTVRVEIPLRNEP
jgi:signal transduction histidine kinase